MIESILANEPELQPTQPGYHLSPWFEHGTLGPPITALSKFTEQVSRIYEHACLFPGEFLYKLYKPGPNRSIREDRSV